VTETTPPNGAYVVIEKALATAAWPDGELFIHLTRAHRLRVAEHVLGALRATYETQFFGGEEHHCTDQQGCRACAVSQFLGTSAYGGCSPMGTNARGVAQCSEGHGDYPDACNEAQR
jgi:hypothetical protein